MRKLQTLGRMVKDLWQFMNHDKLWWISPVLVLLAVMGVFMIVVEGSALAPLIYAMF